MNLDFSRVRELLAAQPPQPLPLDGLRAAAVMVPLLACEDGTHLLFAQRGDHLPHHAGEIAFPGGGFEPTDADLWATALREAQEEVALVPERVACLGQLDDFVSIHGYRVTPYVVAAPWPYPYRPDQDEMVAVLQVPLRHFLDPAIHRREDWSHKGRTFPIHFYRYGEQQIWGLTAAMVRQLLKRLAPLLPPV